MGFAVEDDRQEQLELANGEGRLESPEVLHTGVVGLDDARAVEGEGDDLQVHPRLWVSHQSTSSLEGCAPSSARKGITFPLKQSGQMS